MDEVSFRKKNIDGSFKTGTGKMSHATSAKIKKVTAILYLFYLKNLIIKT